MLLGNERLGKRKRDDNDNNGNFPSRLFPSRRQMSGVGNNDEAGIYCESTESWPRKAVYDPDMEELVQRCQRRISEVKAILVRSGCNTARVRGFLQKATNLEDVAREKAVQVAVLGDSGVGKSATATSVADKPGLAKEGSSGRACTNVPTEMTCSFKNQGSNFAARIQYFNMDDIRDMIREQLEDYVHYNFRKDDKWTQDEKVLYSQRSETAVSTLWALFCDYEIFKSQKSVMGYLNRHRDASEQAVTDLVRMCRARILDRDDTVTEHGRFVEYHEAETSHTLRAKIDSLTCSKAHCAESQMWPLVRNATLGVKGSRVLNSAVITDLPGVSDTNQLRVKSATEYLKECDVLWVVAKIDRVVTDDSVHALLQKYGERFAGKVAVICTRSDDFDMDQVAEDLEADGYNLKDYIAARKSWERNESQAKDLEKSLRELPDASEYKQLAQKLKRRNELELARDRDHETCFKILTTLRNDSITRQLHGKYDSLLPEGCDLKVFCISNKHYGALKGTINIPKPHLGADETGIPALRNHILSLAADPDLTYLDTYIKYHYAHHMKGYVLWAHSTRVKSPDELRKIVFQPQQGLMDNVDKYVGKFMGNVRHHLIEAFQTHQPAMTANALKKVEQIEAWHYASIRAFISKNGSTHTRLIPEQSWNRDFKGTLVKDLVDRAWRELARDQKYAANIMTSDLEKEVIKVAEELSCEPDAHSLQLDRWNDVIQTHLEGIRAAYAEHQASFSRGFANLKLCAESDNDDGFFTQVLQPCYDTCKGYHGTGYKKNVIATLGFHLGLPGNGSTFIALSEKMTTAVEELARACSFSLIRAIRVILARIAEDFENMISEDDPDAEEELLKQNIRAFFADKEDEPKAFKKRFAQIKARYERDGASVKLESDD